MPLTAAERSEINRRNAEKSTGPTSDDGKGRSRRNAVKHGLRAEVLAMPTEDADAVAARADAWNDYYRPESPAAQHLVNQCVQATLLADRCHSYHAAALSSQVRAAATDYDIAQEEQVAALFTLLKTEPATAFRRLHHTAAGCRAMIERWERLGQILDSGRAWPNVDRDEATRLQGFNPDPETLKENPEAWVTRLFNLMSGANPSESALMYLFDPKRFPGAYQGVYRTDWLPDRESCAASLREVVTDRLTKIRALEEDLRAEIEEPDRAGATDRALILADGPSARLFLRYHAEARTAFHRAFGQLVKTLEADTAAAAPAPAPVSPNEPNPTPPVPPAEVSPNEPKPAAEPGPSPGEKTASEAPNSATPTPVVSPNRADTAGDGRKRHGN